jgi:hypothetical protein
VIAGREEAPSAEDGKTPSGYELMPDKSWTHTPPPPQSNACGQVKRRTDATDRRVDTQRHRLSLPPNLEDAHPAPGGFCAF